MEDLLLFRSRADGLEEEKQQANRARSVAEDNVRQVIAAHDQLTGEVKKLKEDKQSLQQQVSRLSEETTIKGTQLYYKQRAIDTLRCEADVRQRAMEQMRAEKGELQQRIDEMEQLLRNAEAASEAAERRLTDNQQVLNIPARDVQLSDKELGSESYGGAFVFSAQLCLGLPVFLFYLSVGLLHVIYSFFQLRFYCCCTNQWSMYSTCLSLCYLLFLLIVLSALFVSSCILSSVYLLGVRIGYWRGCPVAVKSLHEELAKEHHQRRLFEQEVSVCSRLHHPNIASICGVIQQRDAPFSLIMELLQASLSDVIEAALLSDRYLTLREQTDLSHDCLNGLTYLHDLVGVTFNLLSLSDCVCLSDCIF